MFRGRSLLGAVVRVCISGPLIAGILIRANDSILFLLDGIPPLAVFAALSFACLGLLLYSLSNTIFRGFAASLLALAIVKAHADGIAEPMIKCFDGENARPCVAMVTGGNSGIGFATSKILARQGHSVILACRSESKCRRAAVDILNELGDVNGAKANVIAAPGLDLNSLYSVHEFVKTLGKEPIDLLINNAGLTPVGNTTTVDGFERGFGIMHVGHFALTRWLQERALLSPDARVLQVASDAMRFGSFHPSILKEENGEGDLRGEVTAGCSKLAPFCFPPSFVAGGMLSEELHTREHTWGAYPRSKLANVLFAREIGRRHPRIHASSMHPGNVYTAMSVGVSSYGVAFVDAAVDVYTRIVLRSGEQAARVVLNGAQLRDQGVPSGAFLHGLGRVVLESDLPSTARNDVVAAKLWDLSNKWIEDLSGQWQEM